jgi:hypothetical protein
MSVLDHDYFCFNCHNHPVISYWMLCIKFHIMFGNKSGGDMLCSF